MSSNNFDHKENGKPSGPDDEKKDDATPSGSGEPEGRCEEEKQAPADSMDSKSENKKPTPQYADLQEALQRMLRELHSLKTEYISESAERAAEIRGLLGSVRRRLSEGTENDFQNNMSPTSAWNNHDNFLAPVKPGLSSDQCTGLGTWESTPCDKEEENASATDSSAEEPEDSAQILLETLNALTENFSMMREVGNQISRIKRILDYHYEILQKATDDSDDD